MTDKAEPQDRLLTLTDLSVRIQCIRDGMRELPSTRTYAFDLAEPGTVGDTNYIAAAFDDVYLLLSSLLIDGTAAEENTKIRRALAMFINAYANVDGKPSGEVEAAVFRAWIAGAAALGIDPRRRDGKPIKDGKQ